MHGAVAALAYMCESMNTTDLGPYVHVHVDHIDCLRHTAEMAAVEPIIMAVALSYCYELLFLVMCIIGMIPVHP